MNLKISKFSLLFVTLIISHGVAEKSESQREFEAGNARLLKAKFADALTHYHKAIELDPSNYQAIYRRATTYLAVGRAKPGLTDLDTVLAQKPDFSGARQQRANVLFKMGKLSEAAHDFQHLIDHAENSKQFADRLWLVEQSQQNTELARHSYEAQDCEHVLETASKLLVEQPWNSELYLMRGHCFEKMGKLKEAIVELRHASKHSTHNMQLLFEISELQYKRAQIRGALSTIRECLKIDPDHKKCYGSYKNLRKVVKSLDAIKSTIDAQAWPKCLSSGEKLLKSHENDVAVRVNVAKMMCQCNRENGNIGAAIGDCNSALEHDEDDVEAWILRAEAYLADEEHDLAISDYEKAISLDESNEVARSGVEQAKRAKELVGKRDYYKILGVKRSATKREITKAYRKAAQKWHPDNFSNPGEKKRAEKKFIDIASAKEVLTDEEKRKAFDNGQDPLDPEYAQNHGGGGGGGGHPFYEGSFGGGGGGFHSFKSGGGSYFFSF